MFGELGRVRVAALETAHPSEPAVVVRRLALEVFEYLLVREDEERFTVETLDHGGRNDIGLDHPVDGRDATAWHACSHRGPNRLWSQHRHLQPAVAVGDREPLG